MTPDHQLADFKRASDVSDMMSQKAIAPGAMFTIGGIQCCKCAACGVTRQVDSFRIYTGRKNKVWQQVICDYCR